MRKYIGLNSTPPLVSIPYGDTDEMAGTLGDLRAWVDAMIADHGSDAQFSLSSDETVYYEITRSARPEEIEEEKARVAAEAENYKARRRAEFERLKREFEK